jgi:hypothetical protein
MFQFLGCRVCGIGGAVRIRKKAKGEPAYRKKFLLEQQEVNLVIEQ